LAARILIVDGAPAAAQDRLVDHGGARLADNYRTALRSQLRPEADIDCVVLAAGDGAGLPPDLAMSDFDGIAWTGSPLSAYDEQLVVASHRVRSRRAPGRNPMFW
jgi:GMP synthase (glutamine-hydrolysing)